MRILLLIVMTCVAYAQTSTNIETRTDAAGRFTSKATFTMGPAMAMPALTGQPYSAEQVSESVQTLADGTRITNSQQMQKMYRDSAGRTRTERTMGLPRDGQNPIVVVEIYDPVAGYRYVLDPDNKVVHRSAYSPPRPQLPTALRAAPRPPERVYSPSAHARQPQMTSEQLGTRDIEGVMCEGRLSKSTYTVGAIGNDRPITTATESWYAPDLRLSVLMKTSDPRFEERTTRLARLSRVDPDYSLFQPPPDYQIVDETGSFTITITRQ